MPLRYIEDFLSPQQADRLMDWLLSSGEVSWQQETFSIFGKPVEAPRSLAWYGNQGVNYRYTGIDHRASGWPDRLDNLREQVKAVTGKTFNFVLLNRYDHGGQYMGWHKDDERGADACIASLSLGAKRRFRYQVTHHDVRNFDMHNGSLLIFDGQRRHQLAKTRQKVGTRINLTFRSIRA